jgi:rhodanese-related sulfurtransferase
VADLQPEELLALIERGEAPAIVDVRTRAEFEQGHVPGAVNVPFTSLLFGSPALPFTPDEPVVVYCGHGPRARLAAAGLRRRGFSAIRYLAGHMSAWLRAGRPIQSCTSERRDRCT